MSPFMPSDIIDRDKSFLLENKIILFFSELTLESSLEVTTTSLWPQNVNNPP